jgi:hypothetical protein
MPQFEGSTVAVIGGADGDALALPIPGHQRAARAAPRAARSRRALLPGTPVSPASEAGITCPMQVYGRGELSFEVWLAVEREYVGTSRSPAISGSS